MSTPVPLATVSLRVRWGQQMRLKCTHCARYMSSKMSSDSIVRCSSCGQEYKRVGEDSYQPLESAGATEKN